MSVGYGRHGGPEVRCHHCGIRDEAYEQFASPLTEPSFVRSRGWWFCSVEHMRQVGHERQRPLNPILYCSTPDCLVKVPAHITHCSTHRVPT